VLLPAMSKVYHPVVLIRE
ncbi:hypothetical protein A2U01_0099687, partial [Trifolium medium]|nr:hypothetical protein [Trifolium medium]